MAALQSERYGINDGGDVFTAFADDRFANAETPPLVFEVLYFCLSDGFIGRYANDAAKIAGYKSKLAARIPMPRTSDRTPRGGWRQGAAVRRPEHPRTQRGSGQEFVAETAAHRRCRSRFLSGGGGRSGPHAAGRLYGSRTCEHNRLPLTMSSDLGDIRPSSLATSLGRQNAGPPAGPSSNSDEGNPACQRARAAPPRRPLQILDGLCDAVRSEFPTHASAWRIT